MLAVPKPIIRRALRAAASIVVTGVAVGCLIGSIAPLAGAAAVVVQKSPGAPGPYFSAPFVVRDNSFSFGQAPTFTSGGAVLSQEDDRSGVLQVYRSALDGSHLTCLTCWRLKGPNGFAAERPGGGWILFCSYGRQRLHYGSPGLGGYGGDLYAMREDGSAATRLTEASDPSGGADFDSPGGIPYDNYHPYWSPDGRHVAWVRTEAEPLSRGGQRWEIMLGDFVVDHSGHPRLADVRVVGPAFGVYETQQWAPDGSGFLFSAFGPRSSPFQPDPPGWMHQELYFMRLFGPGASPSRPRVTLLSDDLPVYEEQAAFTPDMRDVLFMTNRNAADGSWYDAPLAGSAGTPQFLADFTDPDFRSDLYMVDVRTHDLRALTHFPSDVIPEFAWSRDRHELIWSAAVAGTRLFRTQLGTFEGMSGASSTPTAGGIAPGLAGSPVDMGRVPVPPAVPGSTPQPPPAPPTTATSSGPADPSPLGGLPPVVASYAALWLEQLAELGNQAAATFTHPPIG